MITFEFMDMYEPGEDAPPQMELVGECKFHTGEDLYFLPCGLPRYSDRVKWEGKEYFVYHVEHNLDNQNVRVVCTKKVFHPIAQ